MKNLEFNISSKEELAAETQKKLKVSEKLVEELKYDLQL